MTDVNYLRAMKKQPDTRVLELLDDLNRLANAGRVHRLAVVATVSQNDGPSDVVITRHVEAGVSECDEQLLYMCGMHSYAAHVIAASLDAPSNAVDLED